MTKGVYAAHVIGRTGRARGNLGGSVEDAGTGATGDQRAFRRRNATRQACPDAGGIFPHQTAPNHSGLLL